MSAKRIPSEGVELRFDSAVVKDMLSLEEFDFKVPAGYGTPPMPVASLIVVDHGKTPLQRDANRVLASIDFSRFPVPIRFSWRFEEEITESLVLKFEMPVFDRDTGKPSRISTVRSISVRDLPYILKLKHLVGLVREEVRKTLLHEIDECFLVGGERVFDPHRGEELK